MDQKQHVFPRFLLEQFSRQGQVVLHDRELRIHLPTSVDRALRIGSYYDIDTDEPLEVDSVDNLIKGFGSETGLRNEMFEINGDTAHLRPNALEILIGRFEAEASQPLRRLASQGPPQDDENGNLGRFWIANLIALQFVRGQIFRDTLDQLMREAVRTFVEADPEAATRRWRRQERLRGDAPIEDPIRRVLEGLDRVQLSQASKVSQMLPLAFNQLAPLLFAKAWNVLSYETPDVVTSDTGIGLWARPSRDLNTEGLGIATADAIYFPIDARRILQLTSTRMDESLQPGSLAKLQHSNNVVASAAHRWIVTHPDNQNLGALSIQRQPRVRREEFEQPSQPDGSKRSLIRFSQDWDTK